MKNQAIFIDKDGTLIVNVPYNINLQKIKFTPCAEEGLRILSALGFKIIVVSNQSGIGRGFFSESDIKKVFKHIQKQLGEKKLRLDGFFYCPHYVFSEIKRYRIKCDCRKPANGLFLKASNIHNIDLSSSWMIGDILDDIKAGKSLGCKTILIDNGNETEWNLDNSNAPDFYANTLLEAAKIIKKYKN